MFLRLFVCSHSFCRKVCQNTIAHTLTPWMRRIMYICTGVQRRLPKNKIEKKSISINRTNSTNRINTKHSKIHCTWTLCGAPQNLRKRRRRRRRRWVGPGKRARENENKWNKGTRNAEYVMSNKFGPKWEANQRQRWCCPQLRLFRLNQWTFHWLSRPNATELMSFGCCSFHFQLIRRVAMWNSVTHLLHPSVSYG